MPHSRLSAALQLHDYPSSFPVARSLGRHIHFHLGPTNSGKTYEALMVLQNAASGVYLAPLRLLAMEIRDRLMDAGVPCNLVTGEERVLIPGARHTACTVEMMNPQREVDVAIIDEIQMLQDEGRGYAWTAALVGAPAKEVYVCGSDAVTEPCVRTIEGLGETYEITRLERKTPLVLETESLSGPRYNRWKLKKHIRKGDAVIAFTRKDVLTLSARIRQWGFGVASIYGALSPEVRRTEARRFNDGEADVLVATDAIGMGLNLPIRRVVFSTTQKFDGTATRDLNATEVRQIAGRAGRYGIYPVGYVNAFEDDELLHLDHMLATSDKSDLQKLPVTPNLFHMQYLAEARHSDKIGELLAFFSEQIGIDSPYFETATLGLHVAQGALIDEFAPDLPLVHKFAFSCAPVSLDKDHERDYFLACLRSFAAQKPRGLPQAPPWLASTSPRHLEEAEYLSKDLSLYAWLSFKYPGIFHQSEEVPALRARISRYIEQALLTQAGFGDTSKELFYGYR
ncbi:ATP-dependent RNA helicase SUPV3L1/SUV3 [Novimethylophilus kurashikiensis]|uniref:RNA helicase n=1 Tax=Novimethylophilus kurashikiensis TaxID=1825523 RepID=A0A2R5F9N8_9PROT|nr:DEAD/DEAH box helicase [Novimethylophilus kurashikiensis]GBG13633.1 ATP-dependent RNA helicase SUPV3L1/SUV3 [Novimethylophilus kurashikiensis]